MQEGAGDRTKAHIYHWLHQKGNVNVAVPILESEKAPLENRVWYRYPNQATPVFEGDGTSPTVIARVLDDGTTQYSLATYNARGHVTSRTDPVGRTTNYTYDSNGIDVEEERQVNGGGTDLLASYTYNSLHQPLTRTDAAGETWTYTYNTDGQLLTATNPLDETTTQVYNTDGYLESTTGPVTGATTAFTYDAYGRLATMTEPDGYAVGYTYDAADRQTLVSYPDGTNELTLHDRLDPVRRRDRLGRITSYTYDALRRLVATRDPLGADGDPELVLLRESRRPDRCRGECHRLDS